MSTPNGYNNPAYCHQYDTSLYEYQYVPDNDPDSSDFQQEPNRKIQCRKLVRPNFANYQREPSDSSEFEGSDQSNQSIIVEECNNRRVTLICERRSKKDVSQDEFCEDGNFLGAYYQDISLELENGYDNRGKTGLYGERKSEEKGLRYKRALEPPAEQPLNALAFPCSSKNDRGTNHNCNLKETTASLYNYRRSPRHHRYEEISCDEECASNDSKTPPPVHRYAEITLDQNGYPTLSKEIKIEEGRECCRRKENHPAKLTNKPRAISPIKHPQSFSPPQTPSRIHQKPLKEFDFSVPRFSPNSPSQIIYSSSPNKTNSFEMSELSPPRLPSDTQSSNDHTFFINSPKRQPPIGASAASDSREPHTPNERCILPKNLQQISVKRCHSLPNSPRRRRDSGQIGASPSKSQPNKKITQIFHVKSSRPKYKSNDQRVSEKKSTPARRNISHYFSDQPSDRPKSPKAMAGSPYKPTTAEINPSKTAIITPIFQRKYQSNQNGCENPLSQKRNFEKTSQAFQSTGNILRSTKEAVYGDFSLNANHQRLRSPVRMKRNQSVPNFQTLAPEARTIARHTQDFFEQGNEKYSKNLDLQYSPKKPVDHLSPIDKSRISLIDQTSAWSNLDSDYHPRCSACFIVAAVVHLVTASATCAISFYLLSKVGRKYYLDFGLLAGFVNFILGLLGFRSYCWRWLPNRNYVSGFIGLAAFSALTCAGLTYLVTAKPMAGDPILDIMGGAICAVSVFTIVLALTGLTMSGCCKAPPPDNRVTDI